MRESFLTQVKHPGASILEEPPILWRAGALEESRCMEWYVGGRCADS